MKKLTILCALTAITAGSYSQSKVFKEVSEDISSEMKIISQDDALVGYLLFTQLEKASEDSFNYRISLMDENLNDIGTVNFREESLDLEAVSFEQDVLCLAYLKSNINGRAFKGKKEFNSFEAKNAIFMQFLTLSGSIIKTQTSKIVLQSNEYEKWATARSKFTYSGGLKHHIQLRNIPQKGFACFYGDKNNGSLLSYDLTGKELWKNNIADDQAFSLLTSKSDIYILKKANGHYTEGNYQLLSYSYEGKAYDAIELNDNEGNALKVLDFGNDPVTGTAYVSGNIIDPNKGNDLYRGKDLAKGPYAGVFSMDLTGHTKKDMKRVFTYWNDGSQKPAISKRGFISDANSYTVMANSFRDFKGNTYFVGSEFTKKTKVGAVVASIVTIPTFIIPIMILGASGTSKCKVTDAVIMRLDPKGILSFENEIPCSNSKFQRGGYALQPLLNQRSFYGVSNSDSKSSYIIVDDSKNMMIYNVTKKSLVRTVPHKDGKIRTNVFPAKEGHIMVVERNKKEKYTRLSIEALN